MRPLDDGQCVRAFDKRFDDHFGVNSDMIRQALHGVGNDGSPVPQFADFPRMRQQPEAWGIKVRFIWKLWEYIADDLKGYAAAHYLDENLSHVCLVNKCRWHHAGVKPVARNKAKGRLRQMRANMHLVVERYVKPWTEGLDAGFALMLNAGHMAWSLYTRSMCATELCKAGVYISHSWAEDFEDFARTLHQTLDPEAVVWICSFALYQHGDIAGALSDLEKCPFAVAMRESPRVLLVTDRTTEAVTRCWVVLEALFASKWKKVYDMSLPDDGDADLWRAVGNKLEGLDVAYCHATHQQDKEAILSYAQGTPGGIPALNDTVRAVARNAMKRAELMAAATAGDIERLQAADPSLLEGWQSIRGRTVTHIAAAYSHVAAVVEILRRTDHAHLNRPDGDGCTPLSVAVQSGALASVLALISLQADLDKPSAGGLTPLHFAAAGRQPAIAEALLADGANIEAQGTYQGRQGHRPLTVAAMEGRTELVRALVSWKANVKASTLAGTNALHVAAWEGRTDAAAALITCRAEVDVPTEDNFGRTALMLAFKNGQAAVVSLLLGARANPVRASRQGSNCHSYAISAISSGSRRSLAQARRRRRFDTIMEAGLLVSSHCGDSSDADFAAMQGSCRRFSFMPPRKTPSSTGSASPQCRQTHVTQFSGKLSPTAATTGGPTALKGRGRARGQGRGKGRGRGRGRGRGASDTGVGIPLIERIAQRRGTFATGRSGEELSLPLRRKQPETPKKRRAPGSDSTREAASTPRGQTAPGAVSFHLDGPEKPETPTPKKRAATAIPGREEPSTPTRRPPAPGVPHSWVSSSPGLEDLLVLLSPPPRGE